MYTENTEMFVVYFKLHKKFRIGVLKNWKLLIKFGDGFLSISSSRNTSFEYSFTFTMSLDVGKIHVTLGDWELNDSVLFTTWVLDDAW